MILIVCDWIHAVDKLYKGYFGNAHFYSNRLAECCLATKPLNNTKCKVGNVHDTKLRRLLG